MIFFPAPHAASSMLFKMATKTEIENEAVEESLENQDLNAVCKDIEFSDDNIKYQPIRKRCASASILISSSPKKKKKEDQNIIPPKKFLLGGSISDPLNLNSLQNEDINRAMNKTPKSSPLHSNTVNIKKDHVNVIIPKNLSDPLELGTCAQAKANACTILNLLKQKTPQKCRNLSKSISDSGLLTANTPENNNVTKCNDDVNEKKKEDEIIFFPPNKKLKTSELSENVTENNDIFCTVVEEVLEKIKETLESEIAIESKDKSNFPIPTKPIKKMKTPSPEKKANDCKKIHEQKDKIKQKNCFISTVVSQPSSSDKPSKPKHDESATSKKTKQKMNKNEPKFKEKNALFKYGNYNRYYGYRNPDDEDNRLKVLGERLDLFYGKDVLDIGCNIGHVTFSVARDFGAKSVVGMDIDRKLINIARKNVQYYINDMEQSSSSHLTPNNQLNDYASNSHEDPNYDVTQSFPISLPMLYGPISLPGMSISGKFPYNVSFVQGNYVLDSDVLLSMETCKFDVILCLSITKWLHLNWGDDGLKRAFKRMYAQLRPGGILVVEPQPWKSYGRRKTLTETIWQNYKNIQLKPPMFTEYLINDVGFANCETLALPHHPSKGFQRPLKLYRKPNTLVTRNVPIK